MDDYDYEYVCAENDRLEKEIVKLQTLLVEVTDTLEECYLLLEKLNKGHREGLANTEDVVVSDSCAAVAKVRDHLSGLKP